MNRKLKTAVFLALCCDLGLFSKRLVSPLTNVVTDALHIPGGIATAFSLMFLVTAAALVPGRWNGLKMGVVQSVLALAMGMTGSMGALAPLGYAVPGLVIDLTAGLTERLHMPRADRLSIENGLASVSAALAADCIVFRLHGAALLLYLSRTSLNSLYKSRLSTKLQLS